MMKSSKFFTLAALAALALSSCSKEDNSNNPVDGKDAQLMIRISGTSSAATRALGDPAEVDGTSIGDGYIFVFTPDGDFVYSEALDVEDATGEGQTLAQAVPSVSTVYVVGNIPDGTGTFTEIFGSLIPDLDEVLAATSELTDESDLVTDADEYKNAPLANSDGQPAGISLATSGTGAGANGLDLYAADVEVSPLISRLELLTVKGDSTDDDNGTIVGFDVTGVYVDDYRTAFTWDGFGSGDFYTMNQDITAAGIYQDEDTWSAASVSGTFVAAPVDDEAWVYNVVPGLAAANSAAPISRLIIALDNIKWRPKGAVDATTDEDLGVRYLTVTGYTGVDKFERNKIYRIGGEDGITFSIDDLGFTPNPTNVTLVVTVDVIDWDLVEPDAEL